MLQFIITNIIKYADGLTILAEAKKQFKKIINNYIEQEKVLRLQINQEKLNMLRKNEYSFPRSDDYLFGSIKIKQCL